MKAQVEVTCPGCGERFVGLFDVLEGGPGTGIIRADCEDDHGCFQRDSSGEWLDAVNAQAFRQLGGR